MAENIKYDVSGYWPEDCVLLCPNCGGNNLHQTDVTVVLRRQEDSGGIKVTTCLVDGKPASNTSSVEENGPINVLPGRRDSLDIKFVCEDSDCRPSLLRVMQHKGNTVLSWIV